MIEFGIIVVFVVLGVGLSHLPPIKRLGEVIAESAKKASFEYSARRGEQYTARAEQYSVHGEPSVVEKT